jgi:hypothetical protein
MASTARGPHAARRPQRRPPRRVRWPRRIGGILATAGLFGAAALMASWIAPSHGSNPSAALSGGVSAPTPAPAKAKHRKHVPPKLTAKQLAMRANAVTLIRTRGYLPTREADYDPRHELRVLVGYRNGDPLGPRRAFFFVGTRYIGNDSTLGSSQLKLVKSGNRWATLAYGVYAPGGKTPVSRTRIRFDWNGVSLAPAGAIPLNRLATTSTG